MIDRPETFITGEVKRTLDERFRLSLPQEMAEAVRYYRQALEASDGDAAALNGLRYDLADTLLEDGDREAALSMFRVVMTANPGFRDVQDRIAEIEAGA